MRDEEIIRLAIEGGQHSSLEHKKRFSMCDCISIKMSDSYTAMGAGLELFLKKFNAGEKFVMPYASKLPTDQLKMMRPIAYKIPKQIDTFLWSPFHEATSQYYDLGDGIRYAFRLKGGFLVKFGVAKRIKRPTPKELDAQLVEMNEKIDRMWGPDVKKIMIHYETSRAIDGKLKKRLVDFTRRSNEILGWPGVQMKLSDYDVRGPRKNLGMDENGIVWNGWEHYAPQAYDIMHAEIEQLEQTGE